METRASPFVVGLFTLGVLFGVLVFVFWLGRYGETAGRESYRVMFSDEVTGLSRGSAVLYNGIRVGEVTNLAISPEDFTRVVATIQVDAHVPIRADTRAQLQFQGITGVGIVQLKGGAADAPPITAVAAEPGPPMIEAERSQFQDLMDGAQTLMVRLDAVAERVDTLVSTNEESIAATVRNVETFTTALAENSDDVASFLSDAGSAARRLDTLGARLETLAANIDGIVSAVEPEAVRGVVTDVQSFARRLDETSERFADLLDDNEAALANTIRNAETFTAALAENSEAISSFMADAGAAAQRLDSAGQRIEALAGRADEILTAVDPEVVRSILADAESFTTQLDRTSRRFDALIADNEEALTNTLQNAESFSSELAQNSEVISRFLADAASAASRLDSAGQRIEDLAGRADAVVAAVEPEAVRQIVADARSFTDMLAENSDEISRLAQNAGSAAERLNRLAGNFEGVGESVTRVLAAVDPEKVSRTLDNVDQFTTALAARSGDLDRFMADAGAVAAQLRESTGRFDEILQRVDGMLGEDGEGGFVAEVAGAARAFRELSENLDQRLASLTGDLQRLGGGSLREFQSFLSEGRRTLSNVERVITNLERDPSRLLFGGSQSPEYNPGRRF